MYIIKDFEKEYFASSRLKNKLSWCEHEEYVSNRTKNIKIGKKESQNVNNTIDTMLDMADDRKLSIGHVDVRALAIAEVMGLTIATDDADMLTICEEFEIKSLKTLELVQLYFNENKVKIERVRALVKYWHVICDMPKNCKMDYSKIFEERFPELN